jgi:signal transduction histidine kinase
LSLAIKLNIPKSIYYADTLLAAIHKKSGNMDSAFHYLSAATLQWQSMFNSKTNSEWEAISAEQKQRQADIEAANSAYTHKIQKYGFLSGIGFLFIVASLLMYNNRQRSKANRLLNGKKLQLEETVNQLQTTQKQLVHAEKMASLGELTAGIAHEIQNPLNFVNNFSEVSVELIDELKTEISPGLTREHEMLDNLSANLTKIVHHGKRADSIVKGMLQHSRSSSGKKETVDINNLADEYLRLSYHGLRAKDKSFNSEIETSYDTSIGLIPVLHQDLGRVFLNLFTNAFYSVSAKKKTAGPQYKPVVSIHTKKTNDHVEILISDNGTGVPPDIVSKIFQPFFTTKPTGEGTGLGLSLSYDIITKGHNGQMTVESEEGTGASFKIIIPVV